MTSIEKLAMARAIGGMGRMVGGLGQMAGNVLKTPGMFRTVGAIGSSGLGAYGLYRGANAMSAMHKNPMGKPGVGVAPPGSIAGQAQSRNQDLEDIYNWQAQMGQQPK